MRAGDPGAMSENQHAAIEARQQRLHRIRVRIATAAAGLFVALFSVIYAQSHSGGNVATAQQPAVDDSATLPSDDGGFAPDDGAGSNQPTPMTSGQS
jgi:hypothetical protein